MATKTFQKTYFDVLGLCCSSEVPLIEKLIKPLDGVKAVSVIVASRTLIVVHDNLVISQLQIVNTLNQARLEANVRVYGEANYSNKWPSPYAIACGVFLLLSFLKYVYHPLQWLALVAVAIGILPIVLKGYAALRNFTLDTNILVLIAVVGSIALKDYWEAGSIVFLFTIAQWLESRASHKATAVMSSLMNMVPQKAILAETGEEIDASEVKLNTILAVKAGENVPIDGIVVDGKCEVDEKTLTGESFPVSKQTDSIVWAGTVNLNGYISVKTTALAEDCVVAKMAKLVEEAQNNKSKTQRFIDKCAKFYTPAIVGISICLAAIPAILKVQNQRHWFHLALVVLVSGCPCALILSTPVATFCALSKAATSGVLIKGGEYLETLSKIKIMGFDKTGTITKGEFVVTEFQGLVEGVSLNTLLYWISSIESKSSHPMAAALIDYGRSLSIEPKPENVEQFENYPGEGVYGKINEKNIYIGNRKIGSRAGCETVFDVVPGPRLGGTIGEGKSIGYIFMGGACVGVFSLSDTCRSGVKEAINELKSMGIKTAMLTGDNNEAASIAQNQLEGALEVVRSELLPQDKANIIKEFQKQAPTAMVGDGLNDAPALATADIGISMGVSGSALANETSHVILMSNDIRKIPQVVKLARKAHMKVVQNVSISILTKAAILGLAFGGYPFVWAAVLADVGTCLVVILNSMMLLKGNEGKAKECHKSSWKNCFRNKGCNSHHQTSHSHEHNHNHSHKHDHVFISSGTHNHDCSKPCNDHVKNSNLSQTKGCCAHKHRVKEVEHSHEYDTGHSGEHKECSSNQKLEEKHEHRVEIGEEGPFDNISRWNGHSHSKHCIEKLKENHGVDNEVADSKRSGLSGKHEHRCTKPCDGHVKNRIEKVEHTYDDNTGFNCEHKHEENEHFLAGKYKHCAKIVEKGHLEHITSNGHCHSTCDIQKHEENHDLSNEGAIFCKSDHRCTNHKTEECGAASKVCSSNLEKRHTSVCCRNIREKCCGKNMGFGGKLERLSEVVVE